MTESENLVKAPLGKTREFSDCESLFRFGLDIQRIQHSTCSKSVLSLSTRTLEEQQSESLIISRLDRMKL